MATNPASLISILAFALVPIFVGLLAGYVAGKRRIIDNANLKGLVSLVMTFCLPCSLFLAIVKMPHQMLTNQLGFTCTVALAYAAAWAGIYGLGRSTKASPADCSVLALTVAFPNATAVGLPLFDAIYGPASVAAAAIAITVGAVTITPVTLAILEGSVAKDSLSSGERLRKSVWRALKRPVFWSSAVGIVVAAFNLHLPPYLDRSLTLGSNVTAGAALFLTGLIISAQPFTMNRNVVLATLAKNFLQPLLCFGIARWIGLPPEQTRSAILVTAIPCGFFGLVFGKGFGSSPVTASSTLLVSYLLSLFTLACWITWLGHLH